MQDSEIINLYFARNETAISETDTKYGALARRLSLNIVGIYQDAEECVQDGYHKVWNNIPPTIPDNFKAFLLRIIRNFSVSKIRTQNAKKRKSESSDLLLSELSECISSEKDDPCSELELKELTKAIDRFLGDLQEDDRYIFVRRYWYGDAVKDIKSERVAQRLFRLRAKLRLKLNEEGFFV